MTSAFNRSVAFLAGSAISLSLAATASAQTDATGKVAPPAAAPAAGVGDVQVMTGRPERITLLRMQRPMTIEFTDQRLEDVMTYIKEFTGADMEIYWTDDKEEGLDREYLVNMSIRGMPALAVIERLMEKTQNEFSENGWQMNDFGAIEIGPKDRLNKHRRVEMYDINDLLMVIPDFPDAPEIDLQSVLQQGGQGGGQAQSPFRDDQNGDQDEELPTREERADGIIQIITETVENSQWTVNGGEAASIRFFQGNLIVNAPDYVHRALVGYSYWPNKSVVQEGSRRYVSLNMDTSTSKVESLNPHAVTAVVPGNGGGGGGGGGGGTGGGGGNGTGTGGGGGGN